MVPGGVRIEWSAVPTHVRDAIARKIGSPVVTAITQAGGFSPGVAVRCGLANGQRCFIKAISNDPNPDSPQIHRREAAISSQLPAHLPTPRLLATYDDGQWVVLVFEEVDGTHPVLPWTIETLRATFAALDEIALTPPPAGIPAFADIYDGVLSCWRRLRNDPPPYLDGWNRSHLDQLAELEAELSSVAVGDALLHTDLRADNLLIRADGSVMLVDWPHACVGAAFLDKVFMLPSVGLAGPQPAEVVAALRPFDNVSDHDVAVALAALTGYFTLEANLPDPPGLPTLRQFQRDQGDVARAWLAALID